MKTNRSTGSFHFTVGELSLVAITDGHVSLRRTRPAPEDQEATARAAYVDQLLRDSYAPTDVVDAAVNALVVRTADKVILIDTGFGYRGDKNVVLPPGLLLFPGLVREAGHLLENLTAAGIDAGSVTDVLLTHAHIDHLGGILDASGEPVFPNATVHVSQPEFEFWTSELPDFSRSREGDQRAAMQLAKDVFRRVADRLRYFNDGDLLFGCIRAILAPGHTPGHTMLNIFSQGDELLHVADIAYNAELSFPNPDWGANLDTDFAQAVATRRRHFEELSQARTRAFGSHLPWPGLGFVRKEENGYRWVIQAFSTPQLFE
jgi:glyoxylase-like metal-dependent hydrolase (beta-lactamase superfamily II)